MSYILEALKKSERDRALGQVPSLGAEQVAVRDALPTRRWVLGAVMVLIGLSGGVLLTRFQTGASQDGPEQASPPTAAVQPEARPKPLTVSPTPSPPAQLAARVSAPEAVAPRAVQPPPRSVSAPAGPAPTAAAPGPGTIPGRPSSVHDAGSPPASADVSAPIAHAPSVPASGGVQAAAARPLPAVPAVPANGGTPEASSSATTVSAEPAKPVEVPLLRDLPADVRRELPALHIDVHVYDKNPARRFVLINMHRYEEGETLAAGPRLLRITQGGVVLEYHGVRFRLSSG